MKKNPASQSGLSKLRVLVAFTLCSVSVFLAALGFAANPTPAGWSLITAPSTGNDLYSVACASPSDCWAVGYHIEHWDGTSWAIVASPSLNGGILNGVACASASQCWAVGYFQSGSLYQTIIEQWNGTSWSTIIPSPNPGTQSNFLYGVTCSAADCWAVGYYKNTGSLAQTLILRWDGASWAVFPSPNYPNFTASNVLNGVTCAAASDCWAVGLWNDGESGDSLIVHWNGTSWSISTAPVTGLALNSVACASASECLAVSNSRLQSGQPLIERWNGTTWAIVPSAIPSPSPDGDYQLFSVACGAGSQCWAVGYNNNGVVAQTLIEQWDGSSWSIASSRNTSSTQYNYLFGTTCLSASQCWAVGYYFNNGRHALIEEFAPTIPPLTRVVSRKTHGSAGTFDINLPLTGPRGVECRSGGANGAYKMVFSFVNNVTNCGTASTGSLSSGPGSNQCTVNLTGVSNQQYITVTLSNVLDSQNNTGNVAATMGALIGDTSGNRSVNASDVSQTKSKSGQTANATNFRRDVTVSGSINSSDVSLVKSKSGTALP